MGCLECDCDLIRTAVLVEEAEEDAEVEGSLKEEGDLSHQSEGEQGSDEMPCSSRC